MLDYNAIKQRFDFTDLFENQNILRKIGVSVEIDKGSSTKNSTQYHMSDNVGGGRIVVYNNNNTGKYPHYQNGDITQDKGDVIQFVANRIGGNTQEACKLILENTNNLNDLAPIKEKREFQKEVKPFSLEEYREKGLEEGGRHSFLNYKRGIEDYTIEDKLFKDKVFVFSPFENNPSFQNAFFAKHNANGEIIGAEIKLPRATKSGTKDVVVGNPNALWHSNIPDRVKQVVIVESALDALSYHQEKQAADTMYISSNGNLYKERVESIFQLLEVNNIDHSKIDIIMASDNDLAGFKYDLLVTNQMLSSNDKFELVSESNQVGVSFTSTDTEKLEEVKSYFEKIQYAINLEDLGVKTPVEYIKLENYTNSTKLMFPNKEDISKHSRKLSISLNKGLSFVKSQKIKIDRPHSKLKDWNDFAQIRSKERNIEEVKTQKKEKSQSKLPN